MNDLTIGVIISSSISFSSVYTRKRIVYDAIIMISNYLIEYVMRAQNYASSIRRSKRVFIQLTVNESRNDNNNYLNNDDEEADEDEHKDEDEKNESIDK